MFDMDTATIQFECPVCRFPLHYIHLPDRSQRPCTIPLYEIVLPSVEMYPMQSLLPYIPLPTW